MWQEIGLLGRDNLLQRQIRPRLREKKGFVLTGQHGIGKTALLEWCAEHCPGKKALVSATWTLKEMLQQICLDWGLQVVNDEGEPVPKSKWRVPWMYNAVLAESGCWILIDDIHRITPATLQKLKPVRDRCLFICAGVPPFKKEELRRLLWGLKYVDVKPLKNKEMSRIGSRAAPLIATSTPIPDAVHASRGIPAHLFHSLRGEVTPEAAKTREEEIDISPVLLVGLALIMSLRYLARGIDSSSLYLLSGLGMAGAVIFRFYLYKGMRK